MNISGLPETVWERLIHYSFYQRAMVAAIAAAATCSVLSVLVVLRRMAFIGQGISHAAFGGAGLAILLGGYVAALGRPLGRDLIITGFCVMTALVIGKFSRNQRVREDSMIGICLVSAMALGILMIDLRAVLGETAPTANFHDLLFGSIVMTSFSDAAAACVLALLILSGLLLLRRHILFYTFDPEGAEVFGVRTNLVYYGVLVALALVIVVTMRIVGVVLTSALLIVPGATACLLSRRIGVIFLISFAVGLGSTVIGVLVAIRLRHVSPGAVIVLVLAAAFVLANVTATLGARRQSHPT